MLRMKTEVEVREVPVTAPALLDELEPLGVVEQELADREIVRVVDLGPGVLDKHRVHGGGPHVDEDAEQQLVVAEQLSSIERL